MLHALASLLVRLENLSNIIAWTTSPLDAEKLTIDLVVMPRLQLSFKVHEVDGQNRLICNEHAHLFVPLGPPSSVRKEAMKLLEPIPHTQLRATRCERKR